jgi:Tol biopolymer transport system component
MCALGLAGVLWLGLASAAQAAFPGLNGKIAFQRADADSSTTNIFTIDPTGSGQTSLTANPNDSSAPAYSADGKRIAFVRTDPNTDIEHIWVMDATGPNQTQLTSDSTHNDAHPAFSPDGKRIAFSRDDDNTSGSDQIWVMDATGQNQHPITSGNLLAANPDWSPDGTKIAFQKAPCTGAGCDDGAIFVMDADGQNQVQLTNGGVNGLGDNYPDWSPDGTKIAFSRDYPTPEEGEFIFVMDANGQNQKQLTTISGTPEGRGMDDIQPAFSPDGTKIAFRRETSHQEVEEETAPPRVPRAPAPRADSYIWTMNVDGTNQSQLTTGIVEDQKPDWQPLANVVSAAQIPPCLATGSVTVAVGDTTGFKSPPRGVHYRLDFGAEQVATTDGGVTATIAIPAGRHELEYWGQNQAGDQEAVHHNVFVTVDQTRPRVVILRDQRRVTFLRGQFASVTIRASDVGGTLVRNPSRRRLRVSTARLGTHTVRATATDACGNTATARLTYRVVRGAISPRRVVRPRFTA